MARELNQVGVVGLGTMGAGITEVMARAGIGYAIPGLRHAVAALRHLGWWSQVTENR